ncbi:hypothetical protein DSO57_1023668 [Entomophthora muscae]|uniref:Uncharacterized protein n=1 Tax=Entomophthora muscae TaxID=34485 RepID=A0ACC2RTU5_9FUNG|nr:hypothetical protein DSO57_1023668 [Entomophthora muscae]
MLIFLAIPLLISPHTPKSNLTIPVLSFRQAKGLMLRSSQFRLDIGAEQVSCYANNFCLDCSNDFGQFVATHGKIFVQTEGAVCVFKNLKRKEFKSGSTSVVEYSTSLEWCWDLDKKKFTVMPSEE